MKKAQWNRWAQAAFNVRNATYKSGYATGHESRLLALKYLESGERITGPLRSRFAEVVVDEAQDCSVTDLDIIDRIRDIGIPVVVVADPDQMIYGWRDADPVRLAALEADLGQTLNLTGNWRSSNAVCQLAATLRTGNRPPDLAVRPPLTEPPVILIPTDFPKSGAARHASSQRPLVEVFLDHAQTYAIDARDCLITAYRRAHLPAKSRRPAGNSATRLAHAWRVIHSAIADPDLVDEACRTGARLLMRYWYPDASVTGSLETRCTAVDVRFGDIARHSYAFLYALPTPHADWQKDVNTTLKNWPRPPSAAPRGVVGQLRGKPEGLKALTSAAALYRSDNIHQVKGDEHKAVLLLLPDDDAGPRWIDGNPSDDELLRNWYVAVTRAQHLLAIAIQPNHLDQLTAHLTAKQIPHRIG
jgi:DNA helicase-2/ATP-dependent DNA helicase PcrA